MQSGGSQQSVLQLAVARYGCTSILMNNKSQEVLFWWLSWTLRRLERSWDYLCQKDGVTHRMINYNSDVTTVLCVMALIAAAAAKMWEK